LNLTVSKLISQPVTIYFSLIGKSHLNSFLESTSTEQ